MAGIGEQAGAKIQGTENARSLMKETFKTFKFMDTKLQVLNNLIHSELNSLPATPIQPSVSGLRTPPDTH